MPRQFDPADRRLTATSRLQHQSGDSHDATTRQSAATTNAAAATTSEGGNSDNFNNFQNQTISLDGAKRPHLADYDEIVISGLSGRYPAARSWDAFNDNLYRGVDMVSENETRYKLGHFGLPRRSAPLAESGKFDAKFFADCDARSSTIMQLELGKRKLLEVSYEALCDAGLDLDRDGLRGSHRVGVWCGSVNCDTDTSDVDNSTDPRSGPFPLAENRTNFLSAALDLRGPSVETDSACSSSFSALHAAMWSLRMGLVDVALVAGVTVTLNPDFTFLFNVLGVYSQDGHCRVWDEKASGYVKGEAVVAVVLQARRPGQLGKSLPLIKRHYATLVHADTNADGFKKEGITFPGREAQAGLMRRFCRDAAIDPCDITYLEAHGTGTIAGDHVEGSSIADALCPDYRVAPLLVGAVKSLTGHSEMASGLVGMSKLITVLERGSIPGDLHFQQVSPLVEGLVKQKFKNITQLTPLPAGTRYVALNSFGFGGVNVTVLLSPPPAGVERQHYESPGSGMPVLICVPGRSESGVAKVMRHMIDNQSAGYLSRDFLRLLTDYCMAPMTLAKMNVRGWMILPPPYGDNTRHVEPLRSGILEVNSSTDRRRDDVEPVLPPGDSPGHYIELLQKMGTLYCTGQPVNLNRLLITPQDQYKCPLTRGTPNLSSLISEMWDHSVDHPWAGYPEYFSKTEKTGIFTCSVDMDTPANDYLLGHVIDGRPLFPATGYLWLVVNFFAKTRGVRLSDMKCELRDVTFHRATLLPRIKTLDGAGSGSLINFVLRHNPQTHELAIIESGKVVVSGYAQIFNKPNDEGTHFLRQSTDLLGDPQYEPRDDERDTILSRAEFYRELRVRGYDYGATFQGINWVTPDGRCAEVSATGNWISWMDSLFHMSLLATNERGLGLPTGIRRVQLDLAPYYEPIDRRLERKARLAKKGYYFEYNTSRLVDDDVDSDCVGDTKLDGESDAAVDGGVDLDYEKNRTFKAVLDAAANILVAPGVKIEGLTATATQRRPAVPVTLGSHQFCPLIPLGYVSEYLPADETNRLNRYVALLDEIYLHIQRRNATESWLAFIDAKLNENFPAGHDSVPLAKYSIKWIKQQSWAEIGHCSVPVDSVKWNATVAHLDASLWRDMNQSIPPSEAMLRPLVDLIAENLLVKSTPKCVELVLSGSASVCGTDCTALVSEMLDSAGFESRDHTVHLCVVGRTSIEPDVRHEWSKSISSTSGCAVQLADRDLNLTDKDQLELALDGAQVIVVSRGGDGCDLELLLRTFHAKSAANAFILICDRMGGALPVEMNLLEILSPPHQRTASSTEHDAHQTWAALVAQREDPFGNRYRLYRNVRHQVDRNANVVLTQLDVIEVNINNDILDADAAENFEWVVQLQDILSDPTHNYARPVWLLSDDTQQSGLLGLVMCLRREPGGERIRCLLTDASVTLDEQTKFEIYRRDLVVNVIDKNGAQGTYRYATIPSTPGDASLAAADRLVNCEAAYMDIATNGNLSSFRWCESPINLQLTNDTSADGLVNVHYAALNFKDVMLATGKLPASCLAAPQSMEECCLGMEFAGICRRTGERVMGMIDSKAIAPLVYVRQDQFISVPDDWSLAEAATVPVAYFTVYYALHVRGKLQRGDTVLIHSGSGGVGQAAIRVALAAGCQLYVTVGSQEKRQFLMKEFPQLTANCFASSRSTAFERHVMRVTAGRGVDVVLNCLADDKLTASLRCLAAGGRFLELGKYDMAMNSRVDVSQLLDGGRSFHGILLDAICMADNPTTLQGKQTFARLHELLRRGIETGVVKPLNRTLFPVADIEQAFRYMAAGKHTGKVLLDINATTTESQGLIQAQPYTYFSPDKVYIILGGLGGFGLELAHWLAERGSRKLVMNSRSGMTTAYQRYSLKRLESRGVRVIVSRSNCTTHDGARQLLDYALQHGQVGGIFNLCLVLRDALFENQTVQHFREVTESKVNTTHHLDTLTREMCDTGLDYFVCFSSLVSGRGSAGQTPYGWANSVMERLCENRRRDGLHALALQWGPIGDVGFVVEKLMANRTAALTEMLRAVPQRIHSCLAVLDQLLRTQHAVVSSGVPAYRHNGVADARNCEVNILQKITNLLGVNDPDSLDPSTTLASLGMDSMIAVEIKQALECEHDISLTQQGIRSLTIGELRKWSAACTTDGGGGNSKHGRIDKKPTIRAGKQINERTARRDAALPPIARMPTSQSTQLDMLLNGISLAETSRPVFIFPHLDGDFSVLEPVVAGVTTVGRPAVGLNWPQEFNALTRFSDVIKRYVNRIREMDPTGPYDLIAYSLGTSVVWDVSVEIERCGGQVSSLTLLDAAPTMQNVYSKNISDLVVNLNLGQLDVERLPSKLLLVAVASITDNLLDVPDATQLYTELEGCELKSESRPTRLAHVARFLAATHPTVMSQLPVDHVTWALEMWAWRVTLTGLQFTDPRAGPRLRSTGVRVNLIRAEHSLGENSAADSSSSSSGDLPDMGLSAVLDSESQPLTVTRVPGDHATFLTHHCNHQTIRQIVADAIINN